MFRKFYFALAGLMNVSFIASLALSSLVFDFKFEREPTFLLIICFFLLSLIGSAYFAYRFALPLRRVILKALRLSSKKRAQSFDRNDDDDLFESEPGEYFELETALDKIRKKLKKRRLELAHEREESQALMSHLQDSVVSLGREGRISFFNSRFASMFLSADQLKGHMGGTPLQFTNLFRDPALLKKVETSLANGVIETFQQKMATMLDPHGRHFSVTISPLREEKSRSVYGVIILFHDVSDLKKAEQIRIEFVENASHELRTPLTSVKGFVETAREDLALGRLEHIPQFLATISRSVDRLTDLVNDMLTISTLENAGGMNIELVHPEMITSEVFEQLSPMASDKKIMLKVVADAEPFKADPSMVERVLINLVGNSIKYIPEGGQIAVSWAFDKEAKKIVLRVKDNGPGIAEEHLARLFERFYRIDKARSRDIGGTGLGLAIVKHIMQSHGGTVSANSAAGQGAEFICEFPFRA
ncbi:MAG: PAS domain-containing protein [Bdellovibrionaceae bacterium]|nr:PAS domain-containing protein [Pseudobdellovibrionaceae bacterium]